MPSQDKSYFREASARWKDIISKDLKGVSGQLLKDLGLKPPTGCTYPEFIDGKWFAYQSFSFVGHLGLFFSNALCILSPLTNNNQISIFVER